MILEVVGMGCWVWWWSWLWLGLCSKKQPTGGRGRVARREPVPMELTEERTKSSQPTSRPASSAKDAKTAASAGASLGILALEPKAEPRSLAGPYSRKRTRQPATRKPQLVPEKPPTREEPPARPADSQMKTAKLLEPVPTLKTEKTAATPGLSKSSTSMAVAVPSLSSLSSLLETSAEEPLSEKDEEDCLRARLADAKRSDGDKEETEQSQGTSQSAQTSASSQDRPPLRFLTKGRLRTVPAGQRSSWETNRGRLVANPERRHHVVRTIGHIGGWLIKRAPGDPARPTKPPVYLYVRPNSIPSHPPLNNPPKS